MRLPEERARLLEVPALKLLKRPLDRDLIAILLRDKLGRRRNRKQRVSPEEAEGEAHRLG